MSETFRTRIKALEDEFSGQLETYVIKEYEMYHSDKPMFENQQQKIMWEHFIECFSRINPNDFEEWVEKYRIL